MRERLDVGVVGERAFLLRLDESFLPEVGHLCLFVRVVEGDHIGQCFHLARRAKGGEIRVQVGLELVQQDGEFLVAVIAHVRNLHRVDEDCSLRFEHFERCAHQAVAFR